MSATMDNLRRERAATAETSLERLCRLGHLKVGRHLFTRRLYVYDDVGAVKVGSAEMPEFLACALKERVWGNEKAADMYEARAGRAPSIETQILMAARALEAVGDDS